VLAGADNKTSVTVVMDNSPLSIECMGNDVQKNKKGNTFIPVEDPQLFSIVKVPDNRNHTVRLIPQKRGVKIYMICSVSHSRSDDTGKDRFVRNN
jgi:hypothetical protein